MTTHSRVRLNAATSRQADSELAGGSGLVHAITAPGSVTLFNASHAVVGTFSTIQAAVDAAADNYTVEVGAGTYLEQVVVDNIDGLTIIAATGAVVTIQAPADVIQTGTKANGQGVEAVVTVLNSADVTIDNINVYGHGAANTVTSGNDFVGVFYRNSSGSLLTVDVTGARDPYENGTTAGGHPIISGSQRGQGVLVSNDDGPHLAFTMTGGSITDFQKTGINIRNADLDISGVTITGGGAQTINAQNGIQVQLSTGTINGNTISGIGYAGTQDVYSGGMLLFGNTELDVTGNTVTGSNGEATGGKVVGIWIFDFGIPNSGGQVSGNMLSFVDTGISADGEITPNAIAIHDNIVTNLDTTDPFADGVFFAPNPALTVAFDVEGTGVQDTLNGAAGNDTLTGLGGNDEFQGNGGDDTLHGDAGADQADYAGNFADYTIVYDTDGGGNIVGFLAVTDNNAGDGDEGADTLSSIETLKFADITVNLADPIRLFDAGNNLVGTFTTIQAAVDAAADNYTVEVGAGTYVEQVVVDNIDGLTIIAAAGAAVTIQAPADLVETARSSSGREVHGVLTVEDSANVVIDNIDIDGHGAGDTVDEGGGAGQANFYGVFYRNSSGTLLGVDITGVRDPYPGGTAAGGEPLVSGVQRGVGLVVDNDTILNFVMTGGSISDFQKNATSFNRADLDISGVTVTGGGAQTGNAQNGFQVSNSTGSISGNTITGIGYAGPADAYSGAILAFGNTDLDIKNNDITGSNDDSTAAKVVGIYVTEFGTPNSGGEISGNTISYVDTGIGVYGDIEPSGILIQNNAISHVDTTDPYAAGVDFEPTPSLATPFDVDGSAVADILMGAAGNDVLFGLGGTDLLAGNGGDDTLGGGAGDDNMSGGEGNDIYYVGEAGDLVHENANEGSDIIYSSVSYTLNDGSEVEALAPFSFEGTSSLNFTGNGLNNYLIGNDGANQLNGAAGVDVMVGRDGNDIYLVDNVGDKVFEDAAHGYDVVYSGVSFALTNDQEIEGLSTITWELTDAIDLTGNSADNYLIGNAGSNVLDGKDGNDVLQAREGTDTFAFTTLLGANNVDVLFDFAGADDTIRLDNEVFTGLSEGTLDSNAFVLGTAATTADHRIIYDGATGQLFYDSDGTGSEAAILFAVLSGAPTLLNTDITVI